MASLLPFVLMIGLLLLVFAIGFSGSSAWHMGRAGWWVFVLVVLGMFTGFLASHLPGYQRSGTQKSIIAQFENSGSPDAPILAGDSDVDPPAGFVFDPLTGVLTAPNPLPKWNVLLLKYDSVSDPLQGNQALNGRLMPRGQAWKLPVDATGIEACYWNKQDNTVTGFVVPF